MQAHTFTTFTDEQMEKARSVAKHMHRTHKGYRPCNHDMATALMAKMPELSYAQALELNHTESNE